MNKPFPKPTRLIPTIARHPTLTAILILSFFAVIYWGKIASNRYVSEAHVIIQSTGDTSSFQTAMDLGSLLTGSSQNIIDQMLLRERLLSLDMLKILDAKLDLRSHYSDKSHDIISRMWAKNLPEEWFYAYYLSRVNINFDAYSGVLIIQAEAFDPKTAQAITTLLVEEGGKAMNEMAHSLAREQVASMENQVAQVAQKFQNARLAMIAYQNRKGLASPQTTATNFSNTIAQLQAQYSSLQAQRNVLLGYLSPEAPGIVELDLQLSAITEQIKKEQAQLTTPKGGHTLNSVVEEYERLQLSAGFAQDVYKSALTALEKSRMDSVRTIKRMTVLQTPTLPEYSVAPRRIYNTVVFILMTFILFGILHLIAAIVRDHKD